MTQVIELFHFPVVIPFYWLAFVVFGIYQLLTLQLEPYHSYRSQSLWLLQWVNDLDHSLLFLTTQYQQLLSYVLICSILVVFEVK